MIEVCSDFHTSKSELVIGLDTVSSQPCQGDSNRGDGPIVSLELRDTLHVVEMLEGDSILN